MEIILNVGDKVRVIKPVTIKKTSFNLCKYGVAILIWIGFLLKMKLMLIIAALILGMSAFLGIDRAPMIILGNWTLSKWFKYGDVMLDFNGMRFAHTLGFILNLIGVILVVFIPKAGWGFVLFIAIIKTISAIGYCSGLKLYECLHNDECCQYFKTIKGDKN